MQQLDLLCVVDTSLNVAVVVTEVVLTFGGVVLEYDVLDALVLVASGGTAASDFDLL